MPQVLGVCGQVRDAIVDDLNSSDPQKQLQGASALLQLSACGSPPPVQLLVPALSKTETSRPARILLYHVLRTCKHSEDPAGWEQAFPALRRDVEQRDSTDVQIAAIKSLASFPHKLVAAKLKSGELVLWGRDPLLQRSAVRLAFVEALGQTLLNNPVTINDPIIAMNGWIDVLRSLFDTSQRVVCCSFQIIGRLFDLVAGRITEPFFDSRVDLTPLLYHPAQLVLRIASDQLHLLFRAFARLKPHHKLSAIAPFSEILLQHVTIERRTLGKTYGLFGHLPSCLSFAGFFSLLDCLDVPLVFEAGRALIKFAQAKLIDPGVVRGRVLPVFLTILSTRPDEIPMAFRTHVAECLVPLVGLLPTPEYQLDAFLRIFFLVCKLPHLDSRLRVLFLFFREMIELSLHWYAADIPSGSPDDTLPSSLFIERFLNHQRINLLLTHTSSDGESIDVKLLRKDLLVALLTCYFDFVAHPNKAAEHHPSRPAATSSPPSSTSSPSPSSPLPASSSSSSSSSSTSSSASVAARGGKPFRLRPAMLLPLSKQPSTASLSATGHSLLTASPTTPLLSSSASSVRQQISSELLDVGVRIFIRNVSCIHWALDDSTLPLELYLKLFRYLFEVFSVHTSAPRSLHLKFYSFIIGGIGSVSVLRVVTSFPLFLSLVSIFGTHIRRLIELTSSSGSKNLMQKANELPLKLLQLIDAFLSPPSQDSASSNPGMPPTPSGITRAAILQANLIPQLLDCVAALATDEALKQTAAGIIEKILHDPLVAVHRRQCSLYIQQLRGASTEQSAAAFRKPTSHLLSRTTTPRDRHYYMNACLYLINDSLPMIAAKSLAKQRQRLSFRTVSGSSDPVLVELCCLANAQYSRLSVFVRLTNVTPMPLTNLSVLVETNGLLRITPDMAIFRIGVLGFRQQLSFKFPVLVSGLAANAVHIAVAFHADHAGDTPRITRTSPFVPPLSQFVYSYQPERADFLHCWQTTPPAFHIDGYLREGVAQSKLLSRLRSATGFAFVLTHRSQQTDMPTYGFFGISWFADQFAFALTFNFAANQHIFRLHARCAPHLADQFAHFLRSCLAAIPGRIALTVEPGQRHSHFTDFDGFPPFEELLFN